MCSSLKSYRKEHSFFVSIKIKLFTPRSVQRLIIK